MKSKAAGWPNGWQWLIILVGSTVLYWLLTDYAERRHQEYWHLKNTEHMVRTVLPKHLSPELVVSLSGTSGPPPENTVLRSDWKYDAALMQAMYLHPSSPRPTRMAGSGSTTRCLISTTTGVSRIQRPCWRPRRKTACGPF